MSEHLERPWEWKCPETVSLQWFPFGHERCLLGRWRQNTHVISANSAPLDRETLCFCSAWGTVIYLPNHWLLWPLHWDSKADPSLGCCPQPPTVLSHLSLFHASGLPGMMQRSILRPASSYLTWKTRISSPARINETCDCYTPLPITSHYLAGNI